MNRREVIALAAAAVVVPAELVAPREEFVDAITWHTHDFGRVRYAVIYNVRTGSILAEWAGDGWG